MQPLQPLQPYSTTQQLPLPHKQVIWLQQRIRLLGVLVQQQPTV